MITIDALRICDGERTPLDGVTMLLTANAVHGIAGEGRSELLRAVYGLAVPESGSVTSGGHPLRRRDMAYLEAEPRFWPGLTAGDCLGLVRRYHPASDPAPLLRRLPVPPAAEAAALPPNERKRLALILLLMQRKRVLLLDEPFCGLDAESVFVVQQLILQLGCEGRTLLVAADSLALLDGICDDLYVLGGGRRPRPLRTLRIRSGGPGSGPLRGLRKNEYLYEKFHAMKIVFATNNAHKLSEVQAVLGDAFTLLTPRDCGVEEDIPEEQQTLEGNASQKSHYLHGRTGLDCFADDTGLEVEALGGAPGVHSARYATDGHDFAANNRLLLKNLEGAENRRARFRTVISLILGGEEHLFEGVVEGRIIDREAGHEGFGYDPLFIPDGYAKTFAEMTTDEKNAVSHRARAVRKLAEFLRSIEK